MRIISNTNKPNDRMEKALRDHAKNTQVYIASAFFSHWRLALDMVENNCTIMLIVRLDHGTSPEALKKIMNNPNIDIRFFTGTYFHPKFYIFGNNIAYLGSSNFTQSGLTTNNEMNVELDSEEPIFEDLKAAFWDYWKQAEVLTEDKLNKFTEIINSHTFPEVHRSIRKEIGEYEYNNVGRTEIKGNSKEKYISNFRKSYQLYITRFNTLKKIYESTQCRRYPNVPLRIEVDRFLWWIRAKYAVSETYKDVKEKNPKDIETLVVPLIKEFQQVKNEYLDSSASERFNLVSSGLSDKNKIEKMDFEELFDVLDNVYAFHDTLRFYNGGHPALKEYFKNENSLDKIKNTVIYLIYGKDDYEERIFNCLYSDTYKLSGFGEHCLKELYGLVNPNDIPICNGRILKSMQWLGYGQL